MGDVALAIPFLRAASAQANVTLLAKPHAAALLRHFAEGVHHLALTAPWTAFTGKYRLLRWPWRELRQLRTQLRGAAFDVALSARPDPRDHALLTLSGAQRRVGFPRAGSRLLLTTALRPPVSGHRADYWRALATDLGCRLPLPATRPAGNGRHIVLHAGAGHAVRIWPRNRFDELAARLRHAGWQVTVVDDSLRGIDPLLTVLESADRFIGNDSGPGHLAALAGVPTFTIFGPQRPELFAPVHPSAAWIEGGPCRYKPCFDACRFETPHCLMQLSVDDVWTRLRPWLEGQALPPDPSSGVSG